MIHLATWLSEGVRMPDVPASIIDVLLGAFGTATAILGGMVRKAWPLWRKADDALTDLIGKDARPGVPRRPGMMERLASMELAVSEHGVALAQLAAGQTQLAAAEQQRADEVASLRQRVDGIP